jgi:hypothetical protein
MAQAIPLDPALRQQFYKDQLATTGANPMAPQPGMPEPGRGSGRGPGPQMAPQAPMAPQPGMPEPGRGNGRGPGPQMTAEQQAQAAQMNPEQLEQFIALLAGDFGGRGTAAQDDMTRADAIRNEGGPAGRTAGGVYQAANPLEHLASGMRRYNANEEFKQAKGERGKAMTDAEGLRGKMMQMFENRSNVIRDY